MSKSSYPLKLPQSIKEAAQRLANEFLKERAGDSVHSDMLPILDKAPDAEPMEGDELAK